MQLSDAEREHIRLSEEYRAEVRAKLAPATREEPWYGKFILPIVMLIATAAISGVLVPIIMNRVADDKRAFEVQSKLIEQIIADDAAAQVNLYAYRGRVADYRFLLLEIELAKRLNVLRPLPPEERAARRAELQQDLVRARDSYNDIHAATVAGIVKDFIEQRGNVERVRLHYGQKAPLDEYVAAARSDNSAEVRSLKAYQNELSRIYNDAAAGLRSCPDEQACQQIFDTADEEMQRQRAQQPEFKAWEAAKRQLVQFISTKRPRV